MFLFFFFFSSRRRHTRCSRDWSSDVCSSDLDLEPGDPDRGEPSRPGDRPSRPGAGTLMPEVHLTINGRSYPVACEEGQESRIKELAQYLDRKTAEFVTKLGQIGEARLLVLAALVITDE